MSSNQLVAKPDKDLKQGFLSPHNNNADEWLYIGLICWNQEVMKTSLNLNELNILIRDTLNLPHFYDKISEKLTLNSYNQDPVHIIFTLKELKKVMK